MNTEETSASEFVKVESAAEIIISDGVLEDRGVSVSYPLLG
jgi:hypothetical protein